MWKEPNATTNTHSRSERVPIITHTKGTGMINSNNIWLCSVTHVYHIHDYTYDYRATVTRGPRHAYGELPTPTKTRSTAVISVRFGAVSRCIKWWEPRQKSFKICRNDFMHSTSRMDMVDPNSTTFLATVLL